MTDAERSLADAVLERLLVGRHLCGIHFYGGCPSLVVDALDDEAEPLRGEVFLRIETAWSLLERWPREPPRFGSRSGSSSIAGAVRLEELAGVAASLCLQRITRARLAREAPHLLLQFEGSTVLALNGRHDAYETWGLSGGGAR